MFFGTAALCNMRGITLDTSATASASAESKINETVAETETSSVEKTAAEITLEDNGDIELVNISNLVAVFAIANEPGDQLISFYSNEDITDFEEFNGAIGENGQFYTIEYVNKQDRNDQDSGRVVSDNFDNMEGYVYSVLGENLIANNTYYLCN
ncbi:MAG: hypothetical protein KKE35_05065 [Actinobacteria bacterium]|nr:hypothetical protein [Actinomycetota bacterium]